MTCFDLAHVAAFLALFIVFIAAVFLVQEWIDRRRRARRYGKDRL